MATKNSPLLAHTPSPIMGEGGSGGEFAARGAETSPPPNPPPSRGRAVNGWLVIDKPAGITSARAVALVKRAIGGGKIGHAGTLDPLATGVLPLALGEATKTVRCATGGRKHYRFCIRWGVATDTDDSEGTEIAENTARPAPAEIVAALPAFTGKIAQRPPAYSAIKLAGRRAYALARAGEAPELLPRPTEIFELRLLATPDPDHAAFQAVVGEGTYIRALARDLAQALGTLGHIVDLRRLAVGRFTEALAISLDSALALGHSLAASAHLLPIETALDDIPALAVTAEEAVRLRHGQCVTPACPEMGIVDGALVGVWLGRRVVALARAEAGALRPVRVILQ
jgi:tRNA pseudouridine55 synthase